MCTEVGLAASTQDNIYNPVMADYTVTGFEAYEPNWSSEPVFKTRCPVITCKQVKPLET